MTDRRCRMCNPSSPDPMSFCSRHALELVNARILPEALLTDPPEDFEEFKVDE